MNGEKEGKKKLFGLNQEEGKESERTGKERSVGRCLSRKDKKGKDL